MTGKGYIIAGADTDIGKTVFAAGLTAYLGGEYWKPAQAGIEDETDSEAVARLAPNAKIHPEAYRLNTPCSPHEAARIDGVEIDLAKLNLPAAIGPLIVEGAGGVLVPYREDLLAADIFAKWGLPVILVASTKLGTISHSLLSLEALRARNITVAGVAFIGAHEPVAEKAIAEIGMAPHLGRLPYLDPLNAETLAQAFETNINLEPDQ